MSWQTARADRQVRLLGILVREQERADNGEFGSGGGGETVNTSGMSAAEKSDHMDANVHGTTSTVTYSDGSTHTGEVSPAGGGTHTVSNSSGIIEHVGADADVTSTTHHSG